MLRPLLSSRIPSIGFQRRYVHGASALTKSKIISHLIRFIDHKGRIRWGDAVMGREETDISTAERAHIIMGDVFGTDFKVTNRIVPIESVLCPLQHQTVGTVRCLGLNYANHAKESKMEVPKYPVLFYKPSTAITGPFDSIPVPLMAQEGAGLDYEGELVVVIGKEGTNIPEEDALDYVKGYTVGNDVSHRDWQLKHGGSQWSHGKAFDGWAPIGPAIINKNIVGDPQNLKIWTKVNGEIVQQGHTSDMVFGVAKTISLLSRGVTLLPGDIIFTGTPEGVGMGRNPPVWLQDGDVVEVGIEKVGTIKNEIVFMRKPIDTSDMTAFR